MCIRDRSRDSVRPPFIAVPSSSAVMLVGTVTSAWAFSAREICLSLIHISVVPIMQTNSRDRVSITQRRLHFILLIDTSNSVSYTHLDVYKRQRLRCMEATSDATSCRLLSAVIVCCRSVSYTHLDVYKRQA